ncbi:(2Fe-2S)-binding protein [Nocardia miyunensis]|uniref:(2Fe-2S)-binding protein n=1 Tax=Nocardia miyunensis TaxID=282684 RepID=UPI000B25B716|nr:(2Fe-2S)-binding protein [Nocardia miyunensis]
MVAVSAGTVVPGVVLTRPEWLAERISDMGISWGTGDARVSGTLWWCMAASSLIDPVVAAYAAGRPAPDTALEHLLCEIRPDGGVERVFPTATPADPTASSTVPSGDRTTSAPGEQTTGDAGERTTGDRGEWTTGDAGEQTTSDPGGLVAARDPDRAGVATASQSNGMDESKSCCAATGSEDSASAGSNLREALARIIPVVAEVSGAGVASLWAIVADAIGNRAIDAGDAEAGARLARQVAGRLPVPRFTDVGGRAFVRRISCCLVFEVPNCQMCTSCPKRPAAERHELLSALAARG